MKTIRIIIAALAVGCAVPLVQTGCQAPSTRTQQVTTLKVLGASAKAGMDAATALLKQQRITVPQWQKVAAFYDTKWQPTFNAAVLAVRSDLSSVASPDLVALAAELASLVSKLSTNTP